MEYTNTATIYREKINGKKKVKFRYDYLLFIFLSFLIGQAELTKLGAGFYTFSLIYWSLFIAKNRFLFFLVTVGMSWGLFWTGEGQNLLYILSGIFGLLLYFVIYKLFDNLKGLNNFFLSLFIGLSFLLSFFVFNYCTQAMPYLYFLRVGEAFLIFFLVFLTRRGHQNLSWKKKHLTGLEMLTIFIVSCAFLIGIASLPALREISLLVINFLLILIISGMTIGSGLQAGIFLAAVYGLILVVVGVVPVIMLTKYLIYAFVTGFIKSENKFWVIMSLFLSFLLYSGFSPTIYDLRFSFIEVILVAVVLAIIPLDKFKKIGSRFNVGVKQERKIINENKYRKYNNVCEKRFKELGEVFSELSSTFKEVIPENKNNKNSRFDDFFYLFKKKNCSRCPRRRICWYQEKEDTYQIIVAMCREAEEKGYLGDKLVRKYLKGKCPYSDKIDPGAKSSFELFQVNKFWKKRLFEKQQIVSEQLAGVSQMIDGLSGCSNMMLKSNNAFQHIKGKFSVAELDIYKIETSTNLNTDKVSINVEMEPCAGNNPCQKQLLSLINREYNYDFRIIKSKCGNKLKDEPCLLEYGATGEFSLEMTMIQKSVSEKVSGDTCLYQPLTSGKDLIVLSDGMGIGEVAANESRAAVNLLKSIIEAGFEEKLAIKTINSALFLRNEEDRFTTLDIAFFDTFNGKLSFNKIGAMSSFIKRGWEVKEIKSSSVPAGILEKVDVSSYSMELKENDFCIMLSDGILDIERELDDKEKWFKQLLTNTSFDKTEDFANYIMETITGDYSRINDDMSLIVFKVIKT